MFSFTLTALARASPTAQYISRVPGMWAGTRSKIGSLNYKVLMLIHNQHQNLDAVRRDGLRQGPSMWLFVAFGHGQLCHCWWVMAIISPSLTIHFCKAATVQQGVRKMRSLVHFPPGFLPLMWLWHWVVGIRCHPSTGTASEGQSLWHLCFPALSEWPCPVRGQALLYQMTGWLVDFGFAFRAATIPAVFHQLSCWRPGPSDLACKYT